MTQANEPNDYDRQLRHINRRLERLEDTQVSPQEFSRAFDRVYEEFAAVNGRFDQLENQIAELNSKFDIIMRYITGGSNPNP
jgi:predicted  nucleic acid-binding Zn-ribbon protein